MQFTDADWPLHSALAWVLTRDQELTASTRAYTHSPSLSGSGVFPDKDIDLAWRALFSKLVDGSIPSSGFDPKTKAEKPHKLLPESLDGLDWANPHDFDFSNCPGLKDRKAKKFNEDLPAFLREGVKFTSIAVDSVRLIREFPAGLPAVGYTSDDLGSPIAPTGPGFMSLTSAAYWIATQGGTKRFLLRDNRVWSHAFRDLIDRISAGQIELIGRKQSESTQEALPNHLLSCALILFPSDAPCTIWSRTPLVLVCSLPDTETQDLSFKFRHNGDCIISGERANLDAFTASDVLFSDLAVRKKNIFDAKFSRFVSPPKTPATAREVDIKATYSAWYEANKNAQKTEAQDLAFMRTHYTNINREKIRELRKELASNWSMPGRRKKR